VAFNKAQTISLAFNKAQDSSWIKMRLQQGRSGDYSRQEVAFNKAQTISLAFNKA
jgi:hypothetical protein